MVKKTLGDTFFAAHCSCFGDHFASSGCPFLSQSLGDIFFKLNLVENPRLSIRISTISFNNILLLSDKYLWFGWSLPFSVVDRRQNHSETVSLRSAHNG